MKFRRIGMFLGTAVALCLLSSEVQAHWCHDIWASAYNLVVRPESDTVTVPSGGSGSLVVYVQNNMSYLLPNFKLTATATGATITATRSGDKVSGTLLPGERGKYTLAITKSGGGTVNATDISFAVSFGNSGQSGMYPNGGGKAAMIRGTTGTLTPTPPPPGLGQLGGQAADLNYSALADYGTTSDGMDKLLQLYCAGRGSWGSGSFTNTKSNCPDAATTVCPTTTPSSGAGDKFMYPRLWAAGHMAIRKSALEGRAAVLRKRLQCGVNDANPCFAGFALMVLGYLGEDADARTFIEGKISGSGDLATIAKAAIVLMGNAADLTKYKADLTTGAGASSAFVKAACMAALAIASKDDAMANSLVPLAKWTEPDTSDNGQGLYPSALLQIVAMDRRGWAAKAGDSGAVSFYGESGSSNPGTGGRVTGVGGGPGNGGAPGSGGATGGLGGRTGTGGSSTPPAGVGGSTRPGGTGGRGTTPAGTGGSGPGGAGGSAVVGSGGRTTGGVGGSVAAGGSVASGGSVAAGGNAPPPSGGSQSPGGEGGNDPTGAGGTTDPTSKPGSGGGGGCNIGGLDRTPALSLLAMGALAFLAIRRRRR
jgi:hypothetical protein